MAMRIISISEFVDPASNIKVFKISDQFFAINILLVFKLLKQSFFKSNLGLGVTSDHFEEVVDRHLIIVLSLFLAFG